MPSVPIQTGPEAHPASLQWVPSLFPGVKRPECALTTNPRLVPGLRKERAIPLPSEPSWPVTGRNLLYHLGGGSRLF